MSPRLSRSLPGLAIIAGLAWLVPAPAAHAQFTYGYDSLVTYPPAQTFWYNTGYAGVYTDPTTGVFLNGIPAPYRGVAPYVAPPFGSFGVGNGLGAYRLPNGVAVAPPRPLVAPRGRQKNQKAQPKGQPEAPRGRAAEKAGNPKP